MRRIPASALCVVVFALALCASPAKADDIIGSWVMNGPDTAESASAESSWLPFEDLSDIADIQFFPSISFGLFSLSFSNGSRLEFYGAEVFAGSVSTTFDPDTSADR